MRRWSAAPPSTGSAGAASASSIRGGVRARNRRTTASSSARSRGHGRVNGSPSPALYCAVIVKRVDEKTRSKTSINELLRD